MLVRPEAKERLLGSAVLTLRQGRLLKGLSEAPHGLIVLAGPPGTGKTTLAHGLAQAAARVVAPRGSTTLVEIDPHAFPSDLLGASQRAISVLFRETLPELAAQRPHTVVIIDEVEAFAVRRNTASFETNPVDVHRATDAVLQGLDQLRARCPQMVLVVTTNFLEAVDEAVLSRVDLLMTTELPDDTVIEMIIRSSLSELAGQWHELRHLALDLALHEQMAGICSGLDGRRVRKVALSALSTRPQVALDPQILGREDLLSAARWAARGSVTSGLPAVGGDPSLEPDRRALDGIR